MKTIFVTLGWVLGIAAFCIVLYFYNTGHSNNVGSKEIQQYIDNCENIQLIIADSIDPDFHFIKGDKRMLGDATFPASSTLFYDSAQNKYFIIQFFYAKIKGYKSGSYAQQFDSFMDDIKKGDSITASINKIELMDTSYGTKSKPIPIFKFSRNGDVTYKTFEDMIGDNNNDNTKDTIEISHIRQLYPIDVGIYLSFIKSKEDFEQMFGKGK